MMQCLSSLWFDENGQDLVEYSLLLVFFLMTGFLVFGGDMTPAIKAIWTNVVGKLDHGQAVANGQSPGL